MATRRPVKTEKDSIRNEDVPSNPVSIAAANKNVTAASAVPRSVLVKLLMFTFAMIVFPLSSYYLTINTIFKDRSSSSTLAAATAAVVANIVLIGYIIVAANEDDTDGKDHERKSQ
ncbi:uncharacterized protein H6S33_001156 [Morchella sextelata]|uniref:uncharacterized protein n=1 Tax=Morchella sextelata TaxID=1174677 RepID=UPI001D059B4A|nr:uncharacterized protein H6S33_001156 [Morchella sextelata]KAH0608928.1 hypothetical protein H6S33_001156 [Morchella sextelata]